MGDYALYTERKLRVWTLSESCGFRVDVERHVAHVKEFREDHVLGRQERPYHLLRVDFERFVWTLSVWTLSV
jgi:hypothetical protein